MTHSEKEIKLQILEQLENIEQEHNVKIPYAIESGSRAWGFASPDSDYDCRFLYVHERSWYLSVFDHKDTIEYTPDAIFDVGGWDIKKVIQHIVKSNAVMLEWLDSDVVYRMNEQVYRELAELGQAFFNPVAVSWHYLSMAKNKLAEIGGETSSKIKKYFYILRPLACIRFIELHGRVPHMAYLRNLQEIDLNAAVLEEIHQLLEQKKDAAEGFLIPQNEILLSYFKEECTRMEVHLTGAKFERNRNFDEADETFRRILDLM